MSIWGSVAISAGSESVTGAVQPPPTGRVAPWTVGIDVGDSVQTATELPLLSMATFGWNAPWPVAETDSGAPNLPPFGRKAALMSPSCVQIEIARPVPSTATSGLKESLLVSDSVPGENHAGAAKADGARSNSAANSSNEDVPALTLEPINALHP